MPDLDKPPADKPSGQPAGASGSGVNLSTRQIIAIVVALVCLVFVFSNTGETTLSFLWIDITAAGWIFLFLLLALGFLAGFMIGRNRYKKKGDALSGQTGVTWAAARDVACTAASMPRRNTECSGSIARAATPDGWRAGCPGRGPARAARLRPACPRGARRASRARWPS